MQNRPAVGVAVIVIKDGKVLLGKRKGAHGEGSLAFPGGHLELNESIEACAQREVFEETGICISGIREVAFTNDIFSKEGKHYITLFVAARYVSGQLEIKEPDKCEKWDWFYWNDFPEPLFLSLRNLLNKGLGPVKEMVNSEGIIAHPGRMV